MRLQKRINVWTVNYLAEAKSPWEVPTLHPKRMPFAYTSLRSKWFVSSWKFLKLTKTPIFYRVKEVTLYLTNYKHNLLIKMISIEFKYKIHKMRVNVSIYPCLLSLHIVNWWGISPNSNMWFIMYSYGI